MYSDPDPLASCYAKLLRADTHRQELRSSIQTFIDDHPYRLEAELYSEEHPEDVVFHGRVVRNPSDGEIVRWGAMIGDLAHNLRSALDHLVLRLALSANPDPPEVLSGKWRRIAFPIVTAWDDDRRRHFDAALWGVSDDVRHLIEKFQPATRRPQDSLRDPLAVLHQLWNIDKHRSIHAVKMFVGIIGVDYRDPAPGVPRLNFDVVWKADLGPFVDNAPLARVTPRTDGELIAVSLPQMHMNPRVAFDIAFDEGPPAYGRRMLETLNEISDGVREIVSSLRPYVAG